MAKVVVLKVHRAQKLLPSGYRVNYNPDLLTLQRSDGSIVAYFHTCMVTPMQLLREAEADLLARTPLLPCS
jgi:hypothetical protein